MRKLVFLGLAAAALAIAASPAALADGWRQDWRYHHYEHRGDPGAAIALGIFSGIVGAIAAQQQPYYYQPAPPPPYYGGYYYHPYYHHCVTRTWWDPYGGGWVQRRYCD